MFKIIIYISLLSICFGQKIIKKDTLRIPKILSSVHVSSTYPLVINKGDTIVIPKNLKSNYLIVSTVDQFKKMLKSMNNEEYFKKILKEKDYQLNKYVFLDSINQGMTSTYKEGYVHYKNLWETQNKKLEEETIKASKNWQYGTWGLVIGIVIGTTINLTK